MSTTLDPAAAPRVVQEWLDRVRPHVDAELERRLAAPAQDPGRLVEAMRYGTLGPGKRLRPALALAACEAAGGPRDGLGPDGLAAAAAVELVHAYSLVHDDLPAMDDDDERRGKPTVHVAFGEATAILAGDGLLTAAFAALGDLGARAGAAIAVLGRRAGMGELLRGQAIDLALAGAGQRPASFAALEELHAGKTGALFAAAAELGGIAAGGDEGVRARLARYGMAIGIAFQHADDRDDGDFAEHAEKAAGRMRELCGEAAEIARALRSPTLEAIAAWIEAKA